jgi:ribosome biogenesis protein BRX1
MDDLCNLLPHLKKESKYDTKGGLFELNEMAEMNGCTHCLFFEPKKPQELFIWASKCPSGPSVRFHVQNSIHLSLSM